MTLLAAFKPEAPDTVTTSVAGNLAIISWSEPVTNGSPITSYSVFVKKHAEETYIQESVNCQGSSAFTVTNRQCSIALATLIVTPYNLVLNEGIYVKVISTNVYGDSPKSDAGNGGLVKLVPDAPINLANDASITDANLIRFTWDQG